MIDQAEHVVASIRGYNYGDSMDWPIESRLDLPFTRSNGTILARVYERLTKASRRRVKDEQMRAWGFDNLNEIFYRQGVYDAFKALQEELKS